MSRYTVLGGSGFVGTRLVAALRAEGHDVRAPRRGDLPVGDLGRVVYAIGMTAGFAGRPLETVQAHVGVLSRVLAETDFDHLTYLSSTRLYDSSPATVAMEDAPLVVQPSSPRHVFDLSKALGENLCLTAGQGRCSVVRLSGVYDATPGSPGFLSELLVRSRTERTVSVASSPSYARDYVHLDDAVAGIRAVLDAGTSQIVNVAAGENTANADLVRWWRQAGRELRLSEPALAEAPHLPRCSVARLDALGVVPRSASEVIPEILESAR